MSENDIKRKILNILQKDEELFIGQISKKTGLCRNTVSKYLSVLKAEKKVRKKTQRPYTLWSLKNSE